MYLENISMTYMSPCVADGKMIRFKAELSRGVKELMPYLNAIINNATYNPKTATVFFTHGVRMITLTDRELAVARSYDITDAYKTMDFVRNKVNEAYENKGEITPLYEKRIRTTALDIFSYLPRTNCKRCGEPTCLAFAVKLLLGEAGLAACEPLRRDENYKEHQKEMEKLVEAMGLNP